jgi:hypothetical protein
MLPGIFLKLKEDHEKDARDQARFTTLEKAISAPQEEVDALKPTRVVAKEIRLRAYIHYQNAGVKWEDYTGFERKAARAGNAAAHHGDFPSDHAILNSDGGALSARSESEAEMLSAETRCPMSSHS